MAGKAKDYRKEVTNAIHVKMGRRIIVISGACRLMIVTMKFSDAAMEATPKIYRPMIQKSVPIPVY